VPRPGQRQAEADRLAFTGKAIPLARMRVLKLGPLDP
jgi:hypothetical protein